MSSSINLEPIANMPIIKSGDKVAAILIEVLVKNEQLLKGGDIVCVASKILSIAENRFVNLKDIRASPQAAELHQTLPKKDPRIIQLILDQADRNKDNLRISGSWIGAKNHIGRVLTSAGIDRVDDDTVLLLPESPDASALMVGEELSRAFNANIGVIITDSDGREGIAGATQLCIGLYGVPPLRERFDSPETACDMLAATAGLVMGQRGNNIPAAIIRGYSYIFDKNARLHDAY